MAHGTTARMRRSSEVTWQGRGWPTRGARGARRGHVVKGHTTTRVHVGARMGRHVEGGFAHGGPTGIVGPGKNLGAVTQMRYRAPIFKHGKFHYFLRVGLYPTRFLPFAGDVDARRALDSVRMAEIKTRVSQEECRPNDWARVLF